MKIETKQTQTQNIQNRLNDTKLIVLNPFLEKFQMSLYQKLLKAQESTTV